MCGAAWICETRSSAIPARLAGCTQVVLCSPLGAAGEIHPAILYSARFCGVGRVLRVGGAQAIAAMAYRTETVPACRKLFGPGNAWVTAAKQAAEDAKLTGLTAKTLKGLTFTLSTGTASSLWEEAALPLEVDAAALTALISWLDATI